MAGIVVALLATPVFLALIAVNTNLLPEVLFISFAQARQGVPLPLLVEVLVLEAIVEVIREAGLRLPGPIGQAISIVGAVVIGQSAVTAGLISAPIVVTVALAFIASFTIPSHDITTDVVLLRWALVLLAYSLGVFGIAWGLVMVYIYLCTLESFGMPYLAPLIAHRSHPWQDTVLRGPLWRQRKPFFARRSG